MAALGRGYRRAAAPLETDSCRARYLEHIREDNGAGVGMMSRDAQG